MRLKKIIERFTLVSGLGMKDASHWLPVIADCKDAFESKLGELDERDMRRAEQACAVYAFYRISRMGRLDELRSFKVGDVQMNVESYGEAAEKLWETERAQIADLIDFSGEFGFRSVRV